MSGLLLELLTLRPERVRLEPKAMKPMTTVAEWIGSDEEYSQVPVLFAGGYIYAGFNLEPARVTKIDPVTMDTVDSWIGDADEVYCVDLAYDGTYIYAALDDSPAKVIKIDPVTMTKVDRWVGEIFEDWCHAVTYDGTYIYAGLDTLTAQLIKIDPSTMTKVDKWVGGLNENRCGSLASDGTYVYFGDLLQYLWMAATIYKIDPGTMASVDKWEGVVGEDRDCFDMVINGPHLYVGLRKSPSRVKKVNRATMETVGTWDGTPGENTPMATGLAFCGACLYATVTWGIFTPSQVVRINPETMTTLLPKWTGVEWEDYIPYGLASDGTYLYAGSDYGKVTKIDP